MPRKDTIKNESIRRGMRATLDMKNIPIGAVITIGQAEELTGKPYHAIWFAVQTGKIAAGKVGASWFIRRKDALALWGEKGKSDDTQD